MYIASDAGGAYLDSIRVAGNQFDNVHNAVAFAGTGHFREVDISNNIFHMKDNVNIAGSNAWAIHQAYDSTNTVQNILKNSQISNNICSSEAGSSGTLAFLNSINGLSITGNISIAPDDPPINIIGSPGGVTNLSITNNTLLNYCNVDATAKVAIQVNVTIRGAAGPYALNGLYVSGNIIHRDTLGSGFRAFYLEKATSSMTNVSIGPNTIINTNTVADGDYAATALPPFTQTYSTASKTHSNPTATALTAAFGTVDGTMEDAGATYNQTAVNNNFQEAATKINALIVDVANVKQVLNAQIDEAQVDRQVV